MKTKKAKPDPVSGTSSVDPGRPGTPEPSIQATIRQVPRTDGSFPVVGIGASAGGLKAFEDFFSAMPPDVDPGMAFVLVQHLAPDHKSMLTELIKRFTRMQVFEVEDGMLVRPNCAYIIPPNRDMAFFNGTLQLLEPVAPRGQRLPIDFLFRSLAQDRHEHAICIVLSGTGSDGTLGVREVKGEGGMVMVQDPDSTEYSGMLRSAIDTGLVDYVLPVAEMPAQLMGYVARAFGKGTLESAPPALPAEDTLKKIFILLRSQTGHDFSFYKRNTVLRRIERRLAVHRIERMDDYVRYLQKHSEEVDSLFRDLLIGVTHFFRDPPAFDALQQQVIPALFEGKAPGAPIRVWVPGCSTGEEAYSIAILLQEHMEAMRQTFNVQIFATDIDSRAIQQARFGSYPLSVAADIPPERLARYFLQESGDLRFRIHKNIRDLVIFSEQDVIKDPPFSKLDLISCRNLMIYMGESLQKKLIPLFHYALNPGGKLFLGTSESVGESHDLFASLDRKSKLYHRKSAVPGTPLPWLSKSAWPLPEFGTPLRSSNPGSRAARQPLRELTERAILQQFTPVGVLINDRGDILYLHGRSGRYLEPAPGESNMNILKMAREGLRRGLTIALHKAVASKEPVHQRGLRVRTNGDYSEVDLTVSPVLAGFGAEAETYYLLVVLEENRRPLQTQAETGGAAVSAREPAGLDARVDARIAAMNQELKVKEEYLQTANEELETSNEELRSSNEELQSVNEELQSTNEELETSKEELQSVNEELATVNAELQQKVADLSQANNDMNNLLAGTGVGTVFVDHRLRIQRFTPAVTQVINLILTDVGRPVGHIASNLVGYDRLVVDIQGVLDTLIPKEIEVQTQAGAWYLLRIRPYRTLENVIEGAVITFTEITELKKAQAMARETESLRRLAAVVQDAYDAITLQDLEGRILAWNPGAERLYGWSEAEAIGKNIRDMIPAGQHPDALASIRRLKQTGILEPFQSQRRTKDGRIVDVWLTASALLNETGEVYAIATTEHTRGFNAGAVNQER